MQQQANRRCHPQNGVMLKLYFAMALLLFGCDKKNKNSNCEKYEQVPVVEVDAPDSGSVNQDIPVSITFIVFNGCGQFGKFEESVEKKLVSIKLMAKYSGCICTDDIPKRTTTYHFKAPTPSVYILQFGSVRDVPAISDTITIE